MLIHHLSAFGELFFASRGERTGHDTLGADVGVTYLLTGRIAVDAAVVTTLTGRGPDYALQVGASARFGREKPRAGSATALKPGPFGSGNQRKAEIGGVL